MITYYYEKKSTFAKMETEIIDLQQKIGKQIRSIREAKEISQQDFAAICNFEKSNMSRIESGRSNLTLKTLHTIAQALCIDISDLFKTK